MDLKDKWVKVDMDFLKQMVILHNKIAFGKIEEAEFDKFVLENKEKLNNPDYLQIFSERMSPLPDYYKEHFEMCKFFYDFMVANPEWNRLNFDLQTLIRLGVFQDTFKTYLEEKQ